MEFFDVGISIEIENTDLSIADAVFLLNPCNFPVVPLMDTGILSTGRNSTAFLIL